MTPTVELSEVLRRRRMVRNFSDAPVADADLDAILRAGARGASAGNTQATSFVVLVGAAQTRRYWDRTLPPERRESFRWPGLLHAPVLVVVTVNADRYIERYAEPDKAHTGLGADPDTWPVPYWHVDGGMAVMNILLATIDRGLGALFFGIFEHEAAVRDELSIPENELLIGTIAIGHARPDEPGRSADRPRSGPTGGVHLGGW